VPAPSASDGPTMLTTTSSVDCVDITEHDDETSHKAVCDLSANSDIDLVDHEAVLHHQAVPSHTVQLDQATPAGAVPQDKAAPTLLHDDNIQSDDVLSRKVLSIEVESAQQNDDLELQQKCDSELTNEATPVRLVLQDEAAPVLQDNEETASPTAYELRLESVPSGVQSEQKATPEGTGLQQKVVPDDCESTPVEGDSAATQPDRRIHESSQKLEEVENNTRTSFFGAENSNRGETDTILSAVDHNQVSLTQTETVATDIDGCEANTTPEPSAGVNGDVTNDSMLNIANDDSANLSCVWENAGKPSCSVVESNSLTLADASHILSAGDSHNSSDQHSPSSCDDVIRESCTTEKGDITLYLLLL